MFVPGDKVKCTAPIDDLNIEEIYEVAYTNQMKTDGRQAETVVHLVGKSYGFLEFRFKLHRLEPAEVWSPKGAVIQPESTAPVNWVDEDLSKYSGASKHDSDKIDLSLIPYISSIEHAKAFMVGEKKYGRYNYTKGHKASQLVAAAERHLKAWFQGESHDPKDGQHHLGSVMACCSMILRQEELGTLKDDRYKPGDDK